MARPKKEIKQKEFEALCAIQCTEEEICSVLDVSDKVLNTWCKRIYKKSFSEVFRQKREGGKTSLRRKQWLLADTSAAMAIWLGKQILGQKEKQDEEIQAEQQMLIENIKTMNDIFSTPAANRDIGDLE